MQPQPFQPWSQAPKCWGWFQFSLQCSPTCFKGFMPHWRTLVGSVAHTIFTHWGTLQKSCGCHAPCSFPLAKRGKGWRRSKCAFTARCPQSVVLKIQVSSVHPYITFTYHFHLLSASFRNQMWNKYVLHPPTCQPLMHSWTQVETKMFWCYACTLSLSSCFLLSSWMFGV